MKIDNIKLEIHACGKFTENCWESNTNVQTQSPIILDEIHFTLGTGEYLHVQYLFTTFLLPKAFWLTFVSRFYPWNLLCMVKIFRRKTIECLLCGKRTKRQSIKSRFSPRNPKSFIQDRFRLPNLPAIFWKNCPNNRLAPPLGNPVFASAGYYNFISLKVGILTIPFEIWFNHSKDMNRPSLFLEQ